MGIGYDAVNVAALPAGGDWYLGYIDGMNTTGHYAKVRARFPTATILKVTTTGQNAADICDVESGDATVQIAVNGVKGGLYDIVYSQTSNQAALTAGLKGRQWGYFAADPTGVPHLVPGSLATQWAWPGYGSPGNYDISESVNVPVPPPPAPSTPPEAEMLASTPTGNGYWIVHPDGSIWAYGDATYLGGANPGAPVTPGGPPVPAGLLAAGEVVTSVTAHPSKQGYWLHTNAAHVFAFGASGFHGNA